MHYKNNYFVKINEFIPSGINIFFPKNIFLNKKEDNLQILVDKECIIGFTNKKSKEVYLPEYSIRSFLLKEIFKECVNRDMSTSLVQSDNLFKFISTTDINKEEQLLINFEFYLLNKEFDLDFKVDIENILKETLIEDLIG